MHRTARPPVAMPDPSPTTATGGSPTRLRVLGPADTAEIGSAWTAVERTNPDARLAARWTWNRTWLEHYGDAVDHRVVVADGPDGPWGIALLCRGVRDPRRLVLDRRLHIGTAGEHWRDAIALEYNGLLAAAGQQDRFAAALVDRLRRDRWWDALHLDGFSQDDLEPLRRTGLDMEIVTRSSPATRLADAPDGDVLALLGKGVRGRIRRSNRGYGDVEGTWATTSDEAADILDELADLHQLRWTAAGQPGAFASQRFHGFHSDLARRLVPTGEAVAYRVRARGRTIGCLYGFVDAGRFLFYQSGFVQEDDNKLRPGLTAHAELMAECARRGITEYDFLIGDSRYKTELSTHTNDLHWATVRRTRLRPAALAAVRRGVLAAARRGAQD